MSPKMIRGEVKILVEQKNRRAEGSRTIDKEKGFLHNGHNEEQSNINIHINQLNLLS